MNRPGPPASDEAEVVGSQGVELGFRQRQRVVRIESDDDLVARLNRRREHGIEIGEDPCFQLDGVFMPVAEVGDRVVSETGSEMEDVMARAAGQDVVYPANLSLFLKR